MNFIFYNTKTGIGTRKKYPRKDLEPIIGLSEDIKIYVIIEENQPRYDNNQYYLEKTESYTEEIYDNYEHIFIYRISWKPIEHPKPKIINNLNKSLGDYLDTEYPLWERTKHLAEKIELLNKDEHMLSESERERLELITGLDDWINRCRTERDVKEEEYVTNNVFPDFDNWDSRP